MLNLKCPINYLSFGNVSYNIAKEILKSRSVNFYPISNSDFSTFKPEWVKDTLERSAASARRNTKKEDVTLHLWHISGILEAPSNKRAGLTFHETDRLTATEVNILNQLDVVLVTSNYTKQVFENQIKTKVVNVGLGFDGTHFYNTGKKYFNDDVTVFSLNGKMEKRKSTLRVLKAWATKYGDNRNYLLNASITNPLIPLDQQRAIISQCLGKNYFNINFLPFAKTNAEYNEVLNASDIDLTGMSACEGFNLPLFQSLCLGKRAVVLNGHVHKDYVNNSNAVLVEPNGVQDAVDNIFFRKGEDFNQGQWADYSDDDFISAMEVAARSAKVVNNEGLKLKNSFTYEKTVQKILQEIDLL